MRVIEVMLAAILVAGCANEKPKEQDLPAPQTPAGSPGAPMADTIVKLDSSMAPQPRPETMVDTLNLGGRQVAMRMKLLGEGLPFVSYYPEEELTMKKSKSEEGIGLRFVGNFGGKANDRISVHFFFPSDSSTVSEMTEYVAGDGGAAASAEWDLQGSAQASCPWASVSYTYTDRRDPGAGGSICIGAHRGRAFYMITHFPAENASALESRLSRMLSHLRWKDDGGELRKE